MLACLVYLLSAKVNTEPIASIPFRYLHDEIVARATVNGRPMTVLLDTGTAPSVVDLSFCRKHRLKTKAAGAGGDGGGNQMQPVFELEAAHLRLGRLKIPVFQSLAIDLSGVSKKFGMRIDAVLGDSVFSGHVVQFDYRHRIARFFRTPPKPAKDSVTFPFVHDNGEVHVVGMKIDGQNVDANLDTGSSSLCSLTPRGIRRLHLEGVVAHSLKRSSTGFNGSYGRREGELTSIAFGSYNVAHPTVDFWESGTGHDASPWDVNVGNRFWKNYLLTIDYVRKTVTLSK